MLPGVSSRPGRAVRQLRARTAALSVLSATAVQSGFVPGNSPPAREEITTTMCEPPDPVCGARLRSGAFFYGA
jgi:hypothetical protein